ncbi:hypothetical protein CGCA056_v011703 [Colletotrichum aenigma]|uniref:uncharacterized protein n=1 Tax=Colletotrichum aenigma TaxID=1215731 RepID=UPI001872DA92|nr:uncharacterized protein CGCA056_v011703 [Colletotrichum aenigma]KAF5512040.1 hypothetical protein CGCA056_v011703 [Colletotrichum aenigma]
MKIFCTTLILSFFGAKAIAQIAPIEGYGVADLEWEVEIFPDGRTEIFKGTIEQIVENLQKVNPDWKQDFNISAAPEAAAASVNELLGDDGEWAVTKRADWSEFSVSCFGRWQPADGWHIYEGIEYLARLSGKPTNGPGPGIVDE